MEQFWADRSVPEKKVLPVLGKPARVECSILLGNRCQYWVFCAGQSAGDTFSIPMLLLPLPREVLLSGGFLQIGPACTSTEGGVQGGMEGRRGAIGEQLWSSDNWRELLTRPETTWHTTQDDDDDVDDDDPSDNWRVKGAPDTDRDSLIQLRLLLLRFHQEIGRKKLLGK